MALGYFFLFLTIICGAASAFLLLKAAWGIWKRPQHRWLAVVPLALALPCAAAALFTLSIVWKEPPWLFF